MEEAATSLLEDQRVQAKLARGDRPYVTLKAAISLDGKIATRSGASQWITGEAAREFAHRLRARHEAVCVGINTVIADDPRLTVRIAGKTGGLYNKGEAAQPARVVLDSRCRIAPEAKCLAADGARRIVVAGAEAPAERVAALQEAGAEVLLCPQARPSPTFFLPALRELGLNTLLVEGGGEVHANFIAHGEADELMLIVAGKIIGGNDAPGWCASLGVDSLAEVPRLELMPPEQLGEDLVIRGLFG